MRRRTLVGLGLTVLFLTAGLSGPASATVAEDLCVSGTPHEGIWHGGFPSDPPAIGADDLQLGIELPLPVEYPACQGTIATVQKTDGTHRTTVSLDTMGGTGHPPLMTFYGYMTVPLADGVGTWEIVKLQHGSSVRTLSYRFVVRRLSVINVLQPATVAGAGNTIVNGTLKRYTSVGGLVPSPGRKVQIMHANGEQVLANLTSDAYGRFRALIPFTQTTKFYARTAQVGFFSAAVTPYQRTAHRLLAVPKLSASPTAKVGVFWKVSGAVYPGKVDTRLDYWNGSQWVWTLSSGPSNADGTFARYWKPAAKGTYKVRLSLVRAGLDNSPLYRVLTVTVS
ncbi:hypothetical protein OG394_24800 [Kribbella sp. NBC_01245]|uniref:hypothetical protein n=1 Tax=Kribbella sp. NBC_01245 TaxID=2903578 RepID=UPI002E2CD9B6|nr:hypothetical protein [Kribbella sp. NBC_01245]